MEGISYSLNYVFTCGKRRVRVCRNIYDYSSNFKLEGGISGGTNPGMWVIFTQKKLDLLDSSQESLDSNYTHPSRFFTNSSASLTETTQKDDNSASSSCFELKNRNTSQYVRIPSEESIKLTTDFLCTRRHEDQVKTQIILRVEDSFFDMDASQSPSSIEFKSLSQRKFLYNRKTLNGFLFKSSGLYIHFSEPSSSFPSSCLVNSSEQTQFYPNSTKISLKNHSLSFAFNFLQTQQGFKVEGSLISTESLSTPQKWSLYYAVDVLPEDSQILSPNSPKRVSFHASQVINDDSDSDDAYSSTSTICIESSRHPDKVNQEIDNQIALIQKKHQKKRKINSKQHLNPTKFIEKEKETDDKSSQLWSNTLLMKEQNNQNGKKEINQENKDVEGASSSDDNINSQSIQQRIINRIPHACKEEQQSLLVQPKKNVVKNFVKAFRNYVNCWGDEKILMRSLGVENQNDLREFRMQYKKFESSHKFNNTFIQALILNQPFKPVFTHFVRHEAWEWLEKSQVNNKKAHKDVLSDYLKATYNPSKIKEIHSLRTRNRISSKKMKNF